LLGVSLLDGDPPSDGLLLSSPSELLGVSLFYGDPSLDDGYS